MPPTPEDVAPALLESIRQDFARNLGGRERAARLLEQIQGGAGTYRQANEYAQQVGESLADAFLANLSADVLPDGRMYWNIADRVVRPMLAEDHELVAAAAEQVQTALNKAAGLGLKAQAVPLDEARIKGFLDRLSSELHYEDVSWILGEPVVNFSQAVVDESIRRNVEFQGKSGLRPRVIRRATARCCRWCSSLAGTYPYPNVPKDVYRRHENCRCTVEYDPGTGRRQDVWTKEWTGSADSATMEARRTAGLPAPTHQFQSEELLQTHFAKHQAEYGTISIPEYLRQASELAEAEVSENVVQLKRSDNSISKYRFSTNDFVFINADGTIRTFFKPVDKEAYWKYELDRN